ncbi:MAG: hypothetical protein ABI881_10230 [Betaproteobacteria bacterium]
MVGSMRANIRSPFGLLIACSLLALFPVFAAAQTTVTDSTFVDTDWTGTQFVAGGGGSSSGAQVASGGNPGSFRNVTDVLNAAAPGTSTVVLSTHIYNPFTYTPTVQGAIGLLNYAEDAACTAGCFGSGQSTGPALLQGGNLYILNSTLITGPGAAWAPHNLSGLTAASFGLVSVTSPGNGTIFDNTQHPNFSSAGAPIQVGFFRANGTSQGGGGYTLAAGIDNWSVTLFAAAAPPSASAIPVPALSIGELGALAGLVALFAMIGLRRVRGRANQE